MKEPFVMRRIVRRLHHAQLLASVAVLVFAMLTFAFLALLGDNQRAHIETDAVLDRLQARIVQLGAIHGNVATTNAVSASHTLVFEQTRQQIDGDLAELRTRAGDTASYRELAAGLTTYAASLDALIDAARAGTLSAGSSAEKGQAATALVDLAGAIRENREHLSAESARTWRVTRIGYGGAIVFLAGSVLIITRLMEHRLRRALLDEERGRLRHERSRQFTALMENISDTIVVLDTTGRIRYASPSIEQILGQPAASAVNTRIVDLLHPDDYAENQQMMREIIAGGADTPSVTAVVRVRRGDDDWTWIEAVATNRLDVPGIDGIVINARDITERRRLEEQLRFHALHDPLTGLANRTVFNEHVHKAIQRSRRAGTSFAVMFIDLDNFKLINDTWGHGIGDELLIGVANRLRTVLRAGDSAARQGGDEFVLLIEDIASTNDAICVAERVHLALTLPFTTSHRELFTAASIGLFVSDGTDDANVDDILRYADIAMYDAKRDGRNCTAVYGPVSNEIGANQLLAATA